MTASIIYKGNLRCQAEHIQSKSKIEVSVSLPSANNEKDREILEKTGTNCPVAKSIHPEIELVLNYNWE